MKVVFLGATRGMGKSLARLMVGRSDELFLLGRKLEDLEACAIDLQSRSGNDIAGMALCDLEKPDGFSDALDKAHSALGKIDTVVITAGIGLRSSAIEDKARLMTVDYTNTILFCELARELLLADGGGTICVYTSVAGDRGRKPAPIYGSAKAGLSHYLESIDHKYHSEGLTIVDVKPGFIRTEMTAGMKEPPFAGNPDDVARDVLTAIDKGKSVVYTPGIWRWVMMIVKRLPRMIMRKIDF